ncbi:hypothetical protein [Serratia fonticola]|uniref:hypothetical protein n=1 Tax=Serratia fonticola TaxID=47917 RepID=UPI001AE66ECD|nr:hypothetical protein [Serratia fonticola]MBP1010334.1 hypothetical protein [Serratia fonticola]
MKKLLTLKFLQLDDRKLSEQWLFRLSILIPLVISIMLCIPLWLKTEWDLSAQGYDVFLNLYKLPIGVLSLSIPFVAIVAHIHRTIQTSEQINTTRRKNAADSFFSHHKFMIEAINKISEKDITILHNYKYKIDDPYHLYANFFKNSSYENGIDTRNIPLLVDEIDKEVNEIKKSIVSAREEINNKHLKIILLSELLQSIRTLEEILTICIPESKQNYVVMDKNDKSTVMLVMASRSEIDIKERLDSLLYCIRKVFQLLNIKFNDDNEVHFYSQIKTADYLFFNELFADIIPARIKEQYTIAFKKSNKLDGYYLDYKEKLIRQENANIPARQSQIV